MRRTLLATCLVVAGAVPLVATTASASSTSAPPTSTFIVVLEPGGGDVHGIAADLARSAHGQVGFVYDHALRGFSITASDAAAAALARNPKVAYVEPDRAVSIDVQTVPTGISRIAAASNAAIDIDGVDDRRVDVDVAVIDTGVDFQHPDLVVVDGVNCTGGGPLTGSCVPGGDDDHYHGTHVAGTIGALDNGLGVVGVAPGARIHAVKVLNKRGSGYSSWIIAGIDWVAAHADTIEVANMSLGGSGYSQAEFDAIQGAVEAGVAFAVAAGNDDDLASKYSPAAFSNVLTTSALADFNGQAGGGAAPTCRADVDDTLADFSNYGPAVDIAAPGVCILSTYPIEQGSYGTISGTSMASPHVAGALALLASASNPNDEADVRALYAAVEAAGNSNWTDDSGDGIKEPLLDVHTFVPRLTGAPAPGNTAPTVTITSPAAGTYPDGTEFVLAATTGDADGDTVTLSWTADGATITSPWTPATGSYTVAARADDGNGGVTTATVAVTIGTPTQPLLESSTVNNGKSWSASVTYHGTSSTTGTWLVGTTNAGTCTVPPGGTCTLANIAKKVASVTFRLADGTSIDIVKP